MKIKLISDPKFDSGFGHLSRLISLAQELKIRGGGYCFHPLDNFNPRQIEFIQENSLEVDCSCEGAPDFTIIDTYNAAYIHSITKVKYGKIIQLIDEVTPRGICDGFIEVSPISQPSEKAGRIPILEFENSPLFRDEIYSLKEEPELGIQGQSRGVLVLGGVSDSIYIEVLSRLNSILGEKISNLTIGTSSKIVMDFAKKFDIVESISLQNMSKIAKSFNYVISGAGVTAWELAFLQIPGFVISVVGNQEFQLNYLIKNGYRNGANLFSNMVDAELLNCVRGLDELPLKTPDGLGRIKIFKFLETLTP